MAKLKLKLADDSGGNTLTLEAEGDGPWVAEMSRFVMNSVGELHAYNVDVDPTSLEQVERELAIGQAFVLEGKSYAGDTVKLTITPDAADATAGG